MFVSKNNNPKRKLKYGLELIKANNNLVGINTHKANKIVNHALENNLITELKNNDQITPEVFFNKETRFDFLVEKNKKKASLRLKMLLFLEIKRLLNFLMLLQAEAQNIYLPLLMP